MYLLILPLLIFFGIWLFIFFTLSFSITEVSYQINELFVTLFLFSFLSYLIGLISLSIFPKIKSNSIIYYSISNSIKSLKKQYSQTILKQSLFFIYIFIFTIVIFNIISDGLPPLFGFFGYETINYLEYGRFLGFLIPLSGILIVISPILTSKIQSRFAFFVGVLIILLYINRGPLIFYLFQYIIIKSIISFYNTEDKYKFFIKQIVVYSLFLIIVIAIITIIGEFRSGSESFRIYLRITDKAFEDYNMAFLWIVAYVSIPISNFMHYYEASSLYELKSISFLSSLLPAFLNDNLDLKNDISNITTTIDGVHSYMYNWFYGLGIYGIFLINFFYGIMTFLSRKNILIYTLSINILFFSFFIDYLFYFPTLVQLTFFVYISLIIKRSSK